MSREKPQVYANQEAMTMLMLDSASYKTRVEIMHDVQNRLIESVVAAAAREGVLVDMPAVVWTCHVIGRERFAHDGRGAVKK